MLEESIRLDKMLYKLIESFKPITADDRVQATREVFQRIVLLALYRAKFFASGIFYGGTSLRILHDLDRFSEDLDFTLIEPEPDFHWIKYHDKIKNELLAFGIPLDESNCGPERTPNTITTTWVKIPYRSINNAIHDGNYLENSNRKIKIKLEIDSNPSGAYETELSVQSIPQTFNINSYTLDNLFAGKMHAVLCRNWGQIVIPGRIKGRDLWDLVWFISKRTPLNITHLKEKMIQSGHINKIDSFDKSTITKLLKKKIDSIDIKQAKNDVSAFIKDHEILNIWDHSFFHSQSAKLIFK